MKALTAISDFIKRRVDDDRFREILHNAIIFDFRLLLDAPTAVAKINEQNPSLVLIRDLVAHEVASKAWNFGYFPEKMELQKALDL